MRKSRIVAIFLVTINAISFIVLADEIVIVGTGSGASILGNIGKAFTELYPGTIVTVPKSIGSGGGIKAVGKENMLIGRVARGIKDKEKVYGLSIVPFANNVTVFYVNNSVQLSQISYDQACRIYDGSIRNWSDVDAGTGKIRVIKREQGDSSLSVLQKAIPCFGDITQTTRAKTTYSDPETLEATTGQKNAIAYGTWSDVKLKSGIHALELENKHPTDSDYPATGVLSIIYKEKNNKGIIKTFIEFLATDKAKQAIINAGGLPVQ